MQKMKDVAKSLGYKDKLGVIEKMTKELPDEFDDANLEEALSDYPDFKEWHNQDEDNRKISKYAFLNFGCSLISSKKGHVRKNLKGIRSFKKFIVPSNPILFIIFITASTSSKIPYFILK